MSRLLLCLPVLALTLGACSGGAASSTATGPSSQSTSAAPTTLTATAAPSVRPPASTGTSPSPRIPAPSASTASGATGNGGTAGFVKVVKAKLPEVAAGRSTAEIAAIATTACRSLRVGRSANRITVDARSLGTLDAEATDEATARELVKLAIDTSCIDQAARVDEF
jgi:hypothetical protein